MSASSTRIDGFAFVLIATLTAGLGLVALLDHLADRPRMDWPLARGKVVARESVRLYGLAWRPKLIIQIQPNGPLVFAILGMNAAHGIPGDVFFQYGGDPQREVHLREETSSLPLAIIGFGVSVAALASWLLFVRRHNAQNSSPPPAGPSNAP